MRQRNDDVVDAGTESGRGRGQSRSRAASTPSSSSSSRQPRRFQHQPPSMKDGDRGASAHTVSEEYRIQLTRVLMGLRESSDGGTDGGRDSITLPPNLTNTQRKFVHELSKQMGLKSKSYGKGEDRKVVVSKVTGVGGGGGIGLLAGGEEKKNGSSSFLPTLAEYKQVPLIHVGKRGEEALRKHVSKYPPTTKEEAESRETGSSVILQYNEEISSSIDARRRISSSGNDDDDDDNLALLPTSSNDGPERRDRSDVVRPPGWQQRQQGQKEGRNHRQQQHEKMIQQRIVSHKQAQQHMTSHPQYGQMMKQRRSLPAFGYARDVCDILRDGRNQVAILTGDTGCGKSTQVPQFLLDDPIIGPKCSILVTQPRRISAISVAERVASERCESPGQTVGYSVRLEGCSSKRTQLLFCTPGVLMKRLHPGNRGRGGCDDDEDDGDGDGGGGSAGIHRLSEYTHIIMDEIHERDKNTEFLMIALQDLLGAREDLKLILMSATMPTRDLAEYWCKVGRRRMRSKLPPPSGGGGDDDENNAGGGRPPPRGAVADGGNWGDDDDDAAAMPVEINIPGRTFPVQEFFLEDVLSMTGYVSKAHAEAPDMAQIESDLLSLLGGGPRGGDSSYCGENGGTAGCGGVSQQPLPWAESSLTCVMCGRAGFKCAEELGTHIALCDGGGGVSMLELEDVTLIGGFDVSSAATAASSSVPEDEDYAYGLDNIMEDDMEDYGDEEEGCGLVGGKWDGQSPFGNDTAVPSNKPTLTEDELLTRYQTMYDDEEINYDLTLALVRYVNQSSYGDGAILIFFSGWADISEFLMILESTPPFNDRSRFVLYPLHSGIPSKEQRQVFIKPPRGVRKIILATNIAETSLTIEDVAFVIDTGRAKEKSYDPHLKTSTLQESWISQASAKQRKGRAGRCKAGVCFHLFSKRRHASMLPFVESELVRTPLEEICLQIKQLKLAPGGPDDPDGIPAFLSKAMTPPHSKSVTNALELLCALGAMDEETNELTNLGVCLSALSLEPRVGKMVIMSYLIGCAKASSSMAVAMSYKSPFTIPPPSMRKVSDMARVKLSERSNSDQITSLNVLRSRDIIAKRGQGALVGWCRQNYLNFSSLNMISELRHVVSRELEGLGFPPCSQNGYHNRNGDFNPAFLQASICAGLYPNLAFRRTGDVNFSTLTNRKAKIHLGSVNAVKSQPLSTKCQVAEDQVEFVVFGEMVKGKAMFTMENTTHLVSPLPLLLLCGHLHVKQIRLAPAGTKSMDANSTSAIQKSILSLDEWLVFLCEPEVAAALVVLRQRLDSAFSRITADPTNFTDLPPAEKDAVETLSLVLNSSHNAVPNK